MREYVWHTNLMYGQREANGGLAAARRRSRCLRTRARLVCKCAAAGFPSIPGGSRLLFSPANRTHQDGHLSQGQLAAEKAALELERAKFELEKAALEKAKQDAASAAGGQKKGPFGLPFAFGGK
jgi:hypothetical protein